VTAMLAILKVIWPYLLAGTVGMAIGGYTTHGFDTIALNRQKAAMAGFQQKVAEQAAVAEKAAREALQAQIDQRHIADTHNQTVMDELRQRTADAESHYAADRNTIRSLLNAASHDPESPSGHPVSETESGPGATAASQAGRIELVSETCAALAAEDEWNANHYEALNKQLNGQVEP
jgi:hypothetical protein